MILRGLSGVGKSRLAQWICEHADEEGLAISFRTEHSPTPTRHHGLSGLLARHLRLPDARPETVRAHVEHHLAWHGEDDPAEAAALAALLLPGTDRASTQGDRFQLIKRLLRRVGKPAVVWLDDVQWGCLLYTSPSPRDDR